MIKRILFYYLPMHIAFFKKGVFIMLWIFYRWIGIRTLTVSTKQGIFTISTQDSAISYFLYTEGEFEFNLSKKVFDFLISENLVRTKGVVLFDIGANIGIIGIGLLKAKKVAQVIAIEPETENFKKLKRNICLNQDVVKSNNEIIPLNIALGECRAKMIMEMSTNNFGDHRIFGTNKLTIRDLYDESMRKHVETDVYAFDDMLELPAIQQQKLDLKNSVLWVDVQGYEGFVFKGAKKSLEKGIPTISEIWPYGILRAGMTLDDFTKIVSSYWTDYWVLRGERFVRYPISVFSCYLDELGIGEGAGNVVFTREQ